jgi:serine protease AprX
VRYAVIGATVEQIKSVGGTDIKETRSTGIIFATFTEEQVARLRSTGCTVSKVGSIKAAVMPPAPVAGVPTYSPEQLVWAAGFEELRVITKPPLYGEGFNLAIVDTGIRETHEKIKGRVVYRKNFTSDPMRDGFDHGTAVASVAVAVAPLCDILNIKVLDDEGSGTEEEVVMGIDHVISLHDEAPEIAPSVINLSLGGPDDGNPYSPLRVACQAAIGRGIWVIAAAGNDGPDPETIMSPAAERYVAAIGSVKYEPFTVSNFSSRGPTREGLVKPDAVMFGEDIVMASSSSDTATTAKSGTSFATPFASAMALLYHEGYQRRAMPTREITGVYPELGVMVPIQDMIDVYLGGICVKPQGVLSGKDDDYGYGLPFGPLVKRAIGLRPAIDLSAVLTGLVTVSMLGMMVRAIR